MKSQDRYPSMEELAGGHPSEMVKELASELRDEIGNLPIEDAIKHLPAVPSVREVRTLLDCAKDEPRDYLALRIFYYTGIRLSELEKLRFADVFDDGSALVREGKGGWDRYVCIDARTHALIRSAQASNALSDRIINVHARQIEHLVAHYGRLAGLVQKYEAMTRSFSAHSLRHAFATHRYDAGMDLFVIKRLLGHRFLSTTLIYVRTSMRHERKQYLKTDPLRGR